MTDKQLQKEMRKHDPLCKMADGCAGAFVGPCLIIAIVILVIGVGLGLGIGALTGHVHIH
jgi:hypothetical protein